MKNLQVFKPFYRTDEILSLISKCCEESWTGIGGRMLEFEQAWKQYSGAKTCHMLNSATAGLQLAIMLLKMEYKWSDDSEIITTGLTFVSTNHAILYNNLKPVFADIDQYGCLDPDSVLERITPNTKAILFVGLGGNIGQLSKIIEIAKKKNLILIYDAAHSSGTKWKNTFKQVGCCDDVDVSIFSGQAVKNLPTSDSGWVCWNGSNAEHMDKELRKLSWLGIDKDTFSRSSSEGSYKWKYGVPYVGWKAHANAIDGCFGLVGLKYLEQDNAYRRYLCDIYTEQLKDFVQLVPSNPECLNSRHLFQILVDNRDEVMLALNQYGVYCGVHYINNTEYPMYQYAKGTCPKADDFSNKTISLPLHLYLTASDVLDICNNLKEIIKK